MSRTFSDLTLRVSKSRYHRHRAFPALTLQPEMRLASRPSGWLTLVTTLLDDLAGTQGLLNYVCWSVMLFGQTIGLRCCFTKSAR
jgi:hypothetical protein